MSTIRYKGKDQIGAYYKEMSEANFGTFYGGADPGAYIGVVTEVVPAFDPELQAIYALRTSASAGEPLTLLSKRSVVKCRISWLQQTPAQYYNYWQRWFLKDPPAGDPNSTNFCLEAQIKRDTDNKFYLKFTGLKWNTVTIRGSVGEPVVWTAECTGKSLATATTTSFNGYQDELTTAPWNWKDYYIQYDVGGGYALFPDVTDFEIRVERNTKLNFCFNSTGSLEMMSLEPQEYRVTARLTANLTSKTFLDALLAGTETKLKLLMPDSKYIEMTGGKFRAVEPTLKPEDLIAQRIEYEAKSWTHAFT